MNDHLFMQHWTWGENDYILFRHCLNHPRVRLYEGSFTEWSSYSENPVVKGMNPR